MPPSPTRHRVALAIALAGAALSAFILIGHQQSSTGFSAICNLGGPFSCEIVIGSRYGRFLGMPVALLGLAAFLVGAALAVPGALGASVAWVDLCLIAVAAGSLGFALVLLGVAVFLLHRLCPFCLGIDVIAIAWFLTVAPLAGRFESSPSAGWWRRRGTAHAVALAGLVLATAAGTLAAVRGGPGIAMTLDEVRARDPEFYAQYTQFPVRPTAELDGGGYAKGPRDAPVTIVEFSDFQCPACAQAFTDLHDLLGSRSDVRLVFRHFPLDASCNRNVTHPMHADACLAAIAADCAGQQGRFWEYHDRLFQNQRSLERDSLIRYARELGLDARTFIGCLDDPATRARIQEDVEAGTRAGVNSTPTLFINGRTVAGALERPYYDFALVIEKHERDAQASRSGS